MAAENTAAVDPVQIEKATDPAGKGEAWKLTCTCGKRMLTPLQPTHPSGRCPKCGRLLRLPGFENSPAAKKQNVVDAREKAKQRKKTAPALPAILNDVPADKPRSGSATGSSGPGIGSTGSSEGNPIARVPPEQPDEEIGTIVMDPEDQLLPPILQKEARGHEAAMVLADKLRAKKVRASDGHLIMAWPRAGRLSRCVAGMVDLACSALAAGVTACLGLAGVLPEQSLHPLVLMTAFFSVAVLNDLFLQAFGGSVGKRLAKITLRDKDGKTPGMGIILARAGLKWLLFPGWPLALFDPEARCLHDVVLGTVALKSRK